MNQTEVVAVCENFQRAYKVDQLMYNNKPVWPILRYYMAFVLLIPKSTAEGTVQDAATDKKGKNKSFGFLKNKFLRVAQFLKWPYLYIVTKKHRHDFLKLNPTTVFLSPSFEPYPDVINGKRYSRYLDPYYEACIKNIPALKVQLFESNENRALGFIPCHYINQDRFLERSHIEMRIKTLRLKKQKQIDFYKILNELNGFARTHKIDYIFNDWLINVLDEVEHYERFFYELFLKSNVKTVFFETYYSPCIFGLISACKRLKINTVDIQHGVVDVNYLGWSNIDKRSLHFLPANYWVWSQADYQMVLQSNSGNLKPILGGNMWLGKFITDSDSTPSTEKANKKTYSKTILFSLQHGNGFMDYLTSLILELLNASKKEYFWLMRFHPLSSELEKEKFKSACSGRENIEFDVASITPLYEIFQKADVHIVGSSAVALEGIQFKLPTIIVHPLGADLFCDVITKNIMCYYQNVDDILFQIENFIPAGLTEEFEIKVSEKIANNCFNVLTKNTELCAA